MEREDYVRSWPFFDTDTDRDGGYAWGIYLFIGQWRWVLSTPHEITNPTALRLWLFLAVPLLMLWATADLVLGVALLPLRAAARGLASMIRRKASLAD